MRSIGLIKNSSPCYHNDKEVALMIDPVLVGSVIRGLREKKGKTQEVVSGLAGLDRTHYSKIERGLRSPTLDTLFRIAQALDMKPHELLLEIEKALEA
jgi:transcriptional regulator with XRE-family HTH domain